MGRKKQLVGERDEGRMTACLAGRQGDRLVCRDVCK